ncbi:MAG: segregation/condensation protein A [Beggiatoa sp. IS2]|nr:MAG: segregation/condensation protein A [Beggiatoa sp. IS2]
MNSERPQATIQGTPLVSLPADLHVPADALKVFLENFEGPLDLLLYLIQNHNLDILDIPIAEIARQYLQYIELMKELRLDLAAEYLVMAAELTEIKSRILLPIPQESPNVEADPRTKLVRQLREYARYKQASQNLTNLPQWGRDFFPTAVAIPDLPQELIVPTVNLSSLLAVMQDILARAELFSSHQVVQEPLSVRERMSSVLTYLKTNTHADFTNLFTVAEGRAGVVVTLLAVLELTKESLVKITQTQPFTAIQVLRDETQDKFIDFTDYEITAGK